MFYGTRHNHQVETNSGFIEILTNDLSTYWQTWSAWNNPPKNEQKCKKQNKTQAAFYYDRVISQFGIRCCTEILVKFKV